MSMDVASNDEHLNTVSYSCDELKSLKRSPKLGLGCQCQDWLSEGPANPLPAVSDDDMCGHEDEGKLAIRPIPPSG